MCTALSYRTRDHYFGRNLDLDTSYGEKVCIMPRNFPFPLRTRETLETHYAMIGMATVADGLPLFYEAANECGLGMAGLNFPGNAWYSPEQPGADNIAPYELIPWILGQCGSVKEARSLLERLCIIDRPFSPSLPLASLHWMLSDAEESIVLEATKAGLQVYDDPVRLLTNNPPFDYQMFHLNNYRRLNARSGDNSFSPDLDLQVYCQGLGAVGLPGDVSSMSRFVRAAFVSQNSVCADGEDASVSQFFHLLRSVEMVRGACRTESGQCDITVYTCCINATQGRYYYTTYDNSRISCVDLRKESLDGRELRTFELTRGSQILYQN